jgi:hypothetical protein
MEQTGYLRMAAKQMVSRYGGDLIRTEIVDFYQNAV